MRRRDFIVAFSAAGAWSQATRAQQKTQDRGFSLGRAFCRRATGAVPPALA